jgi:hypothetical protein
MGSLIGPLQAMGLSTAGGLNAYAPLLVVGLLARFTGLVHLAPPYDLLAHPLVLAALGLLAALDFVADKVPGIDHALHVTGLVIHPAAGAVLALAANSEAGAVHPALAAACGLALAGGTHAARMAARPVSTATTGGIANPVVSFCEDVASVAMAVVAILVPILAALLVLLLAALLALALRRRRGRPQDGTQPGAGSRRVG